jgi:NAD(P)H-nitrite reductase large subunit
LRKVEAFCRNKKPVYPSQISECLSAGTGCGWCVPLLKKVHQQVCGKSEPWWRQGENPADEGTSSATYDSAEAYAAARQQYLAKKKQASKPG